MAETSRPWDGTVTGDAGTYSSDKWDDVWSTMWNGDSTLHCVVPNYQNELAPVKVNAGSLTVDTGAAIVLGKFYKNTTKVTVSLDACSGGKFRQDIVVLQSVWASQTVRIAIVPGIEGASPGALTALTQTDLTKYEVAIATVQLSDAGILTVTPSSAFLYFNTEVDETMLDAATANDLVTNGDTHDHVGGDGHTIGYSELVAGTTSRVSHRQGGSATDWSDGSATNNYDLTATNIMMQCGTCIIPSTTGTFRDKLVTFPVAFKAGTVPAVFATIGKQPVDEHLFGCYHYGADNVQVVIAISQDQAVYFDDTPVSWVAIGEA